MTPNFQDSGHDVRLPLASVRQLPASSPSECDVTGSLYAPALQFPIHSYIRTCYSGFVLYYIVTDTL